MRVRFKKNSVETTKKIMIERSLKLEIQKIQYRQIINSKMILKLCLLNNNNSKTKIMKNKSNNKTIIMRMKKMKRSIMKMKLN